ncbi:MFS transporter [Thalassolituus marinus]|uniref:MFS transporter n=1 Tax=Thalassolituus marinus TaxID=671053 RepID=A0ABS7ZQX1_9GAMM|nr:MFS transporter [Thalassolituus marinus]MCA6062985.1 MFS transporter [Thalassolituus marinus]
MSSHNQFELLKQRRFLPYFITQALGAFNDNLYKNALLLLIAFGGITAAEDSALYTNLAAGLFILPFFLFSPIAGQIADKYEKSALIRGVKLLEVGIMLVAAAAIVTDQIMLMMVLLFLMGLQSALFGPVKFSLLPQQLSKDELIGGNALVEMGTFLAILAGTICAGLLFDLAAAKYWIATGVVFFAVAGYLSSRQIPAVKASNADLTINWNPLTELVNTIRNARKDRAVFLSIMAISWFWFLGAGYLTQFPNLARDYLGGNPQVVTLLLTVFSVGVAAGSLLCERLSGHRVELGIVPIGSLGMSIFGIDLYFSLTSLDISQSLSAMEFIRNPDHWRMLIDLAFISISGGLFVVPLQALIQERSDEKSRAQTIAANNVLNALFMVASAGVGILMLVVLKLSIAEYFLVIGLMNIVVALYVYSRVPEFALRFFIWMLTHTMYRVTHEETGKIPEEGPVVLVCNHVSYVDALLIASASRRPVRFVMDRAISEMPLIKYFFRYAKTIPICSPKADEAVYENAFKRIREELNDGQVVCIFPEGKLTKTGETDTFRRGIERIIEETPVPVIPMALSGLWGSFFSHKDGLALTKTPRRFWSKVTIKLGQMIAPENVSADVLQTEVNALLQKKA